MLKHLVRSVVLAVATTVGGGAALAAQIIAPPISVDGPEHSDPWTIANLFEGTVTSADLNVTSYGTGQPQWAGLGEGPHEVFMDFGTSISTVGIACAQRAGDHEFADKVSSVDFWFSNDDFGGVFPLDPPDTTATITNTTNDILTTYSLGGTFSGQYVAARFNAAAVGLDPNNPGGSEMRFLAVPEPSGMLLGPLACVALVALIKRRGGR